jgi:hypothetical protein
MRKNQRVTDMVYEVLERQARKRARQTGESPKEALEAVAETEAGRQLLELGEGPHGEEKAQAWQKSLPQERAEERREERGREG